MSTVINVHDFKTHYSKYLARVKNGERLIVGERGAPVAEIIPLSKAAIVPRAPGALKGKIWIADDFDAPSSEWMETVEQKKV